MLERLIKHGKGIMSNGVMEWDILGQELSEEVTFKQITDIRVSFAKIWGRALQTE